jgi:hypothetical protein
MKYVPTKKVEKAAATLALLWLQLPKDTYMWFCKIGYANDSNMKYLKLYNYDRMEFSAGYILSDEMARRVDILLSPHARTLFTAWAVKTQHDCMEAESDKEKYLHAVRR